MAGVVLQAYPDQCRHGLHSGRASSDATAVSGVGHNTMVEVAKNCMILNLEVGPKNAVDCRKMPFLTCMK